MNYKQVTKQLARYKKQLDRDFRKQFKQVRTKIRRIKDLKRQDKKVLIADLAQVNGDLMDVLWHAEQFTSTTDYLETIQAYLSLEIATFDYNNVELHYMPGKMKELIQLITNQHKINDLKDRVREIAGL